MANSPTTIISAIAGPYSVTYGGSDLGIFEDAPAVDYTPLADDVTGDNLGGTIQDGVYRGVQIATFAVILQEFSAAGAAAAFWPFSATLYDIGTVGRLLRTLASPLVLTAIAGTTAVPATLTCDLAVLAPGVPVSMMYGSRLRNIPMRMYCLPSPDVADSDKVKFFK